MAEYNLKEKRLFVSYGHDKYSIVAKRLVEDLTPYCEHIWFDSKNIREFHGWTDEIEDGIKECDIVLALMTKHAYRRPSGVCINEIIFANNNSKVICPILVEKMEVPLLLCSIQYFDINSCINEDTLTLNEAEYSRKFVELLAALQNGNLDFVGYVRNYKEYLKPQDNTLDVSIRHKNFIGRKWLFDEYLRWKDDVNSNLFVLQGLPGSGKTSFLCHLLLSDSDIHGIHMCKYNDKTSTNLVRIIKSMAFYLLIQNEEYASRIAELDFQSIERMQLEELFKKLIVEPLNGIKKDKKVIYLLDALDELEATDAISFLNLLKEYKEFIPSWFKIVISTRKEPHLLPFLKVFNPREIILDSKENIEDLKEYCLNNPNNIKLTEKEIDTLIVKSEGSFQYLKQALDEYDTWDIDSIPNGINSIYQLAFKRITSTHKEEINKLLSIMTAAYEPLSVDELKNISSLNNDTIKTCFERLGSYLINKNGKISFCHKSVSDWLNDYNNNPIYYISKEDGNNLICNYIESNIDLWEFDDYLLNYGFKHLILDKRIDALKEVLSSNNIKIIDNFVSLTIEYFFDNKDGDILRILKSCNNLSCSSILASKIIKKIAEYSLNEKYTSLVLKIFNNISWLYDYACITKAKQETNWDVLIELSNKIKDVVDKDTYIEIIDYLGDAYRISGERDKSIACYQEVLRLIPSYEHSEKCFVTLYNYYDMRYVEGYLKEATDNMLKYEDDVSSDLFKQYKMYRLLGNISFYKEDMEKSIYYFNKCLDAATKSFRRYGIAEAYYSLAECYATFDNQKAIYCIEKSREISRSINSNYNIAKSYFASIERMVTFKEYEEAINEGMIGVQLLTENKYITGVARIKRNMAEAYYQLGEYEKALEIAMMPLKRYQLRNTYPIERIKTYLVILKAASKLNKLDEYKDLDSISAIKNLHEFPNAKKYIDEINELLEKQPA